MNENKSVVAAFGGVRGIALLVVGFSLVIGYNQWQRRESHSALDQVAREMGLVFNGESSLPKMHGRVDKEYYVSVETTSERSVQQNRYYTRFQISPPQSPPGRIVAASLRQQVIAAFADDAVVRSGDEAFDDAVRVTGPGREMLAALDAAARKAILAATDAGWVLEDHRWQATLPGREGDAEEIKGLLDVGLGAAKALRTVVTIVAVVALIFATVSIATGAILGSILQSNLDNEVTEATAKALRTGGDIGQRLARLAEQDPLPSVRAAAGAALAGTDTAPAAATANSLPSFDSALAMAAAGDQSEDVRWALITALPDRERQARAIAALAQVGGKLEAMALRGVTGEHQAAAKAAIAAIEGRMGCSLPCAAEAEKPN